MWRASESGRDITLFDGKLADQIGPILLVDDRGSRLQGCLSIDDRRQGFEIDRHQLGGILSLIAALRHDHRDRLANMPDLVQGQHRLLRMWMVCCTWVRHLLGSDNCAPGTGGAMRMQIGTSKHLHDAWHRCSAGDIDRAYAAHVRLGS